MVAAVLFFLPFGGSILFILELPLCHLENDVDLFTHEWKKGNIWNPPYDA